MEGNPFAPPGTTDLDGGAAPGTGPAIAEESVQELVVTAPWTGWLARLGVLSIALGVIGVLVTLVRAQSGIESMSAIVGVLIATPVTVVFVVILRRYASHGRRLASGDRQAVEPIIEAQHAYLKATGVATIVGFGIGVLAVIAGTVAAVLGRLSPQ